MKSKRAKRRAKREQTIGIERAIVFVPFLIGEAVNYELTLECGHIVVSPSCRGKSYRCAYCLQEKGRVGDKE